MTKLVELLAEHAGLLLVGPTLLLGLGVLGVTLARAAVHRQRLAELAVAATLVWLVLAWVPLPRPEAAGLGWWVKIDWAQPRPMPAAAQQPVPPVAEGHVADRFVGRAAKLDQVSQPDRLDEGLGHVHARRRTSCDLRTHWFRQTMRDRRSCQDTGK